MHPLLEMVLSNAAVATVLALLAAVVSQLCRRPALTHSLWLLVLLKLVTPPLMPVQLPWSLDSVTETPVPAPKEIVANHEPSTTAAEPDDLLVVGYWFAEEPAEFPEMAALPVEVAATTPASAPDVVSCSWVLLCLWPAGSLAWLMWASWHAYRFHRLLRHAQPASVELRKQADELARKLGLTASPGVWLVPGVVSPMIWAIGRAPRLILPIKLVDRLECEQVAALLLHELAHVRRRDHWVRFLEIITTVAFWWHPVVWWARRELHEAEEQCCDAWVVWALAGAERAYALALIQTAAFFSGARLTLPAAASGIGQVPHLRRRLTMILQARTPRSLSWAGCLVVFGLGLFLLPLVPVHAQQPAKDPFVQPPAEKESVDQQIEILKKAIIILEKQKYTEKPAKLEEKKVDPAELKKAQEEIDQLAKQLEVKRAEVKALEAKLQQAKARVGALQGWRVEFDDKALKFLGSQNLPHIEMKLKDIVLPADALKAIEMDPKMLQDFIKVNPDVWPGKSNKAAPKEKKSAETLEQKLDRLMKEMEELRKEIRKDKPSAYYQPIK